MVFLAPRVGFEPTTPRLTAAYSTVELSRIIYPGSVLSSQGPSPQVLSALKSLTSVFGMGTGVASSLLPPGNLISNYQPFSENRTANLNSFEKLTFRLSPRPISTSQLQASLPFHTWPINQLIYLESYLLTQWEISSQGGFHA